MNNKLMGPTQGVAADGTKEEAGRDEQMTTFLEGVVGVVDANSYEHHMLWAENQRRDRPKTWREHSMGMGECVGMLADMPVCLSLRLADVDGHRLLFLDATSQVVDHRMIDEWLLRAVPKTAFRDGGEYVNRVDAMNFHNVFRAALHSGGRT